MSKLKAILCMDIDGTLIDSHERVHPKDIEILKAFPDHIQPIIATGRTLQSTKGVLLNNGLFNTEKFPLPAVSMNGGIAYLPEERICIKHSFPAQTRSALIRISKDFPHTTFMFFSAGAVHPVNLNTFGQKISRLHYQENNQTKLEDLPDEIIKVVILDEDRRKLEKIAESTLGLDVEMGYSLPYTYEINPSGITKGSTLVPLLQFMQLDHLPIFVTGDAENDLSLLEVAFMSFAPANALPVILGRADHAIDRNADGLLSPILNQIDLSLT